MVDAAKFAFMLTDSVGFICIGYAEGVFIGSAYGTELNSIAKPSLKAS